MRKIEQEDIVDNLLQLTENKWYRVTEEIEEVGNRATVPKGPTFSTREEAKEYVSSNEGVTNEDIDECSINEGFRNIAVRVGEPLEQVASALEHVEELTDDDKRAIVEAFDSTYSLLDELEEALAGDLDRVRHPMLQHGERDGSWKCYTMYEERAKDNE